MIKILNIVALLSITTFVTLIFLINFFDYNQNIFFISIITNSEEKINELKDFISKDKLNSLNYLFFFYIFVLIFFLFVNNKFKKHYYAFSKELKLNFQNYVINKKLLLIFIIIIIPSSIIKIYFLVNMAGTYDELFTVINFTSKGFITSLSYYPAPNNHILYSVISSIFNYLPLNNLILNRVISYFIGIVFLLVLFSTITKEFNLKNFNISDVIIQCYFSSYILWISFKRIWLSYIIFLHIFFIFL